MTFWNNATFKIFYYRRPNPTPATCVCQFLLLFFCFPQMYNFTNFAMSLNELEPGMEAILAPTDCRFRPDIRAMENGNMSNDKSIFYLSEAHLGSSSHLLYLKRHLLDAWLYFAIADEASTEKERLEEKQRAARKERAKNDEEWSTRWVNAPQHAGTNGALLCPLLLTWCRDVDLVWLGRTSETERVDSALER